MCPGTYVAYVLVFGVLSSDFRVNVVGADFQNYEHICCVHLVYPKYDKGTSDEYVGVTKIVFVGERACADRNADLKSAG